MNFEQVSQLELEEILTSFNNEEQTEEQTERLIWYIISEFSSKGKTEFTNQEIRDRMAELVVGKLLRELNERDLIDITIGENKFEDTCYLTEKGKQYVADLLSDNNLPNTNDNFR